MNKLLNIEQALKTNPEVGLAHKVRDVSFPSAKGRPFIERSVVYFVAPEKGLYTAESLQKFMKTLVPTKIETASERINFSEDNVNLNFGSLHFNDYDIERIFNDCDTEIMFTKIEVYPFPSKAFVRDLLEKKESCSTFFITKEILENYKGFRYKILSKLSKFFHEEDEPSNFDKISKGIDDLHRLMELYCDVYTVLFNDPNRLRGR